MDDRDHCIYFCLGVLLLYLLIHPRPAAQDLVRVFFTAPTPDRFAGRLWPYAHRGVYGHGITKHSAPGSDWCAAAVALALFSFVTLTQETFFGQGSTLNLPALITFVGQHSRTRINMASRSMPG